MKAPIPALLLLAAAGAAAGELEGAPAPPELVPMRERFERLRAELERSLGELDALRELLAPATIERYAGLRAPLRRRLSQLSDDYYGLYDELERYKSQFFFTQLAETVERLGKDGALASAGVRLGQGAQLESLLGAVMDYRSSLDRRLHEEEAAFEAARAQARHRALLVRASGALALVLAGLCAALWRARRRAAHSAAALLLLAAGAAAGEPQAPGPPELAPMRERFERLRSEMERSLGELGALRELLAPATIERYEERRGPLMRSMTQIDDEYSLLREELKAFKTQYVITQAVGVLDELGAKDGGVAAGLRLAEGAQVEHLARLIAEFRSDYNTRILQEREAFIAAREAADRRAAARRIGLALALVLTALFAAILRSRRRAAAAACLALLCAPLPSRAQEAELARLQADFAEAQGAAAPVLAELLELTAAYESAQAVSPYEERRRRMNERLHAFQIELSRVTDETKQLRTIYHMSKFAHLTQAIADERLRAGAADELTAAMRLEDLYKRLSVLKRELGSKARDEDWTYRRIEELERRRRTTYAVAGCAGALCAGGLWLLRRKLTRP